MVGPKGEPSGSERVKGHGELGEKMRFAVCCDRRKFGEDYYFSLQGLTTEDTERELFTIQQRTSAARLEGKYEPRMAPMGTDKEGLGCSRRANGAAKKQTSASELARVSIFLRQSHFAGSSMPMQAICE